MQLRGALISLLLASCCVNKALGRHAFQKRQASTDAATTTQDRSTQASDTDNASSTAASSSGSPSSADASKTATTPTSSSEPTSVTSKPASSATTGSSIESTIPAASAITVSADAPSATESQQPAATASPHALPLTPKITPAIGIAGCILIILGAALCIVGIKHKWLYIFLSTAFLASLAVTVLIVYLMNPPVKDAIQGAYMVAAVVTGLVFGALALIFTEVAEGLGCLLGGFCVAMWFLVLSPGGLIDSTAGRGILIGVFCLVFFGLYFSQYTRMYGLIGCTAFAGAQITVVGIDCFSRAGLKEFWLYIWNLNDNEFPIGTTTYPITRGMKVEIACTIILFVLGVMSQLKIWKIVRERREKKDAERLRQDESKEQLEAELGRDLEASNRRDREQWEAVYGDKHTATVQVDSGVGSSIESLQKRPTSVAEREVDGIEMTVLPGVSSKHTTRSNNASGPILIRVASDEAGTSHLPTQSEEHLLNKAAISRSTSHRSAGSQRSRSSHFSTEARERLSMDRSQYSTAEPGPEVTPLPFRVPIDEPEDSPADDNESVLSRGSAGMSVLERRGMPLTRISLNRKNDDERVRSPRIEEDRASSVAATADGGVDTDALSVARLSAMPSPYQFDFEKDGLLLPSDDERDRSRSPERSLNESALEEEDDEAIIRPSAAAYDAEAHPPKTASKQRNRKSTTSSRRCASEEGASEHGDNTSLVGSLRDHLPDKMSKVAMTYRTNEWAKHIADADRPDEEGMESHSPGIQVDHAFAEESARPVDTEALKSAETPLVSGKAPKGQSKNPYRQSTQGPKTLSRTSSGATTPVYAFQRGGPGMSLNRQTSNGIISAQPKLHARGPTPTMAEPLVESPVEDALASSGPYRNLHSAMSLASQHNLMGVRQSRLNLKPTATSFNALMEDEDANAIGPADSASVQNVRLNEPDSDNISLSDRKHFLDQENMTLAQRKALVQEQQQWQESSQPPTLPQPRSGRRDTWSAQQQPGTANQKSIIYDSHQPKRSNTIDNTKKSNMLSQWRQSLAQDAAAKQPLLTADDMARQQMMGEKRQADYDKQLQTARRESRESAMDIAMRTGQFHGAHRDAMRRMQAKASRQVTL